MDRLVPSCADRLPGRPGFRRVVALLAAVGVLVAAAAPATAGSASGPADRPGVELVTERALSPRLSELRVLSPAMGRELAVRVLTPEGFDPEVDHLPVLWLLHGGFGSAADWTDAGAAEALTAGLPMIVVMPEAGTGGWYSDWRNGTAEGPQRWETFHLDELRPWIEHRYRTRTDRGGRAVAGLSMGGFGAIHYAARHPDLFGFAAAFSGAVDILHPGVSLVVSASPLAHQGLPPDLFGDRVLHESRWRANNPVDLAANLRTVEVQLRTGNGLPGGPHGGFVDPIEVGCYQASATLHRRLAGLGIDHVWDDRGPGAHTWDYWREHLRDTLPALTAAFERTDPVPEVVEHLALEPAFSVWGHDVALDRGVYESATLGVRPDGFSLSGTGRGTVTTPARFDPGQVVHAAVTGQGSGDRDLELRADGDGRLTVPVDLGPASLVDEHPLVAALLPRLRHLDVTLTPVAEDLEAPDADDTDADDTDAGPVGPGPRRPVTPPEPAHRPTTPPGLAAPGVGPGQAASGRFATTPASEAAAGPAARTTGPGSQVQGLATGLAVPATSPSRTLPALVAALLASVVLAWVAHASGVVAATGRRAAASRSAPRS